jgi:xylulokinase
VGVVSASGAVLGAAWRPVHSFEVEDGGYEQDPDAVWRAVVEASQEALKGSGVPAAAVVAVLCDSHFFSVVCLGRDGRPTMNLIVWLDRRARQGRLERAAGFRPDSLWRKLQWLRTHGVPPLSSGMDNLAKLRWVKFFRPDVYEKTAAFLEPADYLNFRLSGRMAANACTAFPMQVTDNRDPARITYSPALIRWSGIDAEKFPGLLPPGAVVGTLLPDVAATLGLSPKTRVLAGVNDTQAGAFGCGAFQGNHAGIVLGNSGVMVTHAPRKKTDIRTGLFTLPSPLPDRYFVTGECGVAGRALEHFLEYIIFAEDAFGALQAEFPYQRFEEVVSASPPGSNGVLFLPWMRGAHMPVMEGSMRGGFLNVSLKTRRADLARAVLEGINFLYRHMGEAGMRFTGRQFSHYALYGGGALSDTWAQSMADTLQLPVHRMARPRQTNCLGLGMLAFHHLGELSLDEIASRVPVARVFEPNPALRALYDDKHEAMLLAFKRNRSLFRVLNRGEVGAHSASQVS